AVGRKVADQLAPSHERQREIERDQGDENDQPDVSPRDEHQPNEELYGPRQQQEFGVVDLRQPDVRKEVEVVVGQERQAHWEVPDFQSEGDDTQANSQRDSQYPDGVGDE